MAVLAISFSKALLEKLRASLLTAFNLKKSVESNPAKKIQHKLDNMFLVIVCI